MLQGPPLDTANAVQQREHHAAGGAEPDRTNCGVAAWTAACSHLVRDSYVYSDLVGYQTSDIRLLWTITPTPPPHPNTLSTPPPPPCQTSPPPPPVSPPISGLSHCHHTLEV